MKQLSTNTTQKLLRYGCHGALLLALAGLGPAAWGQSFGPLTTYPNTIQPADVALGDVNGDGRLDIVTPSYGFITGSILLGQAGGSFAPSSTYTTNNRSLKVLLGDVNGDGRLDIVTTNYNASGIDVLLGQAGGTFAPATTYTASVVGGGGTIQSAVLGDVNGDGRVDIVTANDNTGKVGVLLGQAIGGFAPASFYPVASNRPYGLALGDINGDGQLDIVVANYETTISVLLGQAGGFAAPSVYAMGVGSYPVGVTLADGNGDGRPDIFIANNSGRNIGVLASQAGGGFAPLVTYPLIGVSYPYSVVLNDVNGDGRLDMVANTHGSTTGSVQILLGQAGGTFAAPSVYMFSSNVFPVGMALGDVNGDGRPDIVTSHGNANTVGVLLNTGTYTPLITARPTATEVSLAPNPAHGSFRVQLPATVGPTQVTLLNALGQTVRHQAASANFTVDTQGLAAGLYTLRLTSGAATITKRVAVE